jgi:hypothetical protein
LKSNKVQKPLFNEKSASTARKKGRGRNSKIRWLNSYAIDIAWQPLVDSAVRYTLIANVGAKGLPIWGLCA